MDCQCEKCECGEKESIKRFFKCPNCQSVIQSYYWNESTKQFCGNGISTIEGYNKEESDYVCPVCKCVVPGVKIEEF